MDDDWDLSMEEMDALENNARRQLAERQRSSSTASVPPPGLNHHCPPAFSSPMKQTPHSPSKSSGRIMSDAAPPSMLPACMIQDQLQTEQMLSSLPHLQLYRESPHKNPLKSPMKVKGSGLVAQIYLMDPGHVAVRSAYSVKVIEVCRSIPGRVWNAEERVWVVPRSKMEELVQALSRISVTAKVLPPLYLPATLPVRSEELKVSQSDRESVPSSLQTKPEPVKLLKQVVKLGIHQSGDVAAKFEYNAKIVAAVRTVSRAEWNRKERLWLFPISSVPEAEKILRNISDLDVKVEGLEPLVQRAIEAAAAVPNLQGKYNEIPGHLESKLLQFQRDGVRFALQRGCRVLIADEMGLGKTLQAIAVASCLKEEWPVLIVVPSSLRLQWAMALQQWLDVRPVDITVVMSQCSCSNIEGFNIVHSAGKGPVKLDGLFNIVSYDLVSKLNDAISEAQFKIIIADEAHYLKNAQAKRTNACVPLLQKAKYAVLLTGTPALSRPIELFKQLEALQPTVYKSVHEYGNRYCLGGHFGMYQGSSNLQELHALVKSTIMIRRLKKDVLSELPQKRRQQVVVSLEDKGIKLMRALFKELEVVKNSMKDCDEDDFEKMKYAEKQLLNKIYTESAAVKLPAVEEYLTTMIDAKCKFLVFAHHKIMLDGIEQLLMVYYGQVERPLGKLWSCFSEKKKVGHIRIDGGTPQSSRQALVTLFQENDNIYAAVLGIRAAGVGLTLTAASTVIFAEMSWTPGDLVQAEDRAHRIGQASSVNVYYLHARDTIDEIIWDTVQNKLESLGQVLDGQENSLQVAAPPKFYAHVPRGQGTLDSFVQSAYLNQTCEGNRSSASDYSTLISDPLLDPDLVEKSVHVVSSDIERETGAGRTFEGQGYPPQAGENLTSNLDRSAVTIDSKRKRLF